MSDPNDSWTICQLADFCRLALRSNVNDARRIGLALSCIQARLKDGEWADWLEYNLDINEATADRFLNAERLTVEEARKMNLSGIFAKIESERRTF